MHENRKSIKEKVKSLESELNYILGNHLKHQGERLKKKDKKYGVSELISWLFSGSVNNVLSLPFIYGMIVPLIILDFSVTVYQAICFRLYKIPRIKKSDYIALERHNLGYLNIIEQIHCDYCGYANGLVAFTREILSRTEQYFCPIKHANKILGAHERYAYFLKYGEANDYHKKLESLRNELSRNN